MDIIDYLLTTAAALLAAPVAVFVLEIVAAFVLGAGMSCRISNLTYNCVWSFLCPRITKASGFSRQFPASSRIYSAMRGYLFRRQLFGRYRGSCGCGER